MKNIILTASITQLKSSLLLRYDKYSQRNEISVLRKKMYEDQVSPRSFSKVDIFYNCGTILPTTKKSSSWHYCNALVSAALDWRERGGTRPFSRYVSASGSASKNWRAQAQISAHFLRSPISWFSFKQYIVCTLSNFAGKKRLIYCFFKKCKESFIFET